LKRKQKDSLIGSLTQHSGQLIEVTFMIIPQRIAARLGANLDASCALSHLTTKLPNHYDFLIASPREIAQPIVSSCPIFTMPTPRES
jgi:hypothetical protein